MFDPISLAQLADETIGLIRSESLFPFEEIALRLFRYQHLHNPVYAAWCKQIGVNACSVCCVEDIPSLPISAFKQSEVTVLPQRERTGFFSSSGTSQGIRSRHFFNLLTLGVYEASLAGWFRRGFLTDQTLTRQTPSIISLTPPPEQAPCSSLVHMIQALGQIAPSCDYCGSSEAGAAWTVDWGQLEFCLKQANARSEPVVVIGTAFGFVHLLDASQGRTFSLPNGSAILETGGYKNQSRTLTRSELHEYLAALFQLDASQIRTEYGMSELSSQAYDSTGSPGQFTWPPWVNCRVISPETGQPIADGMTGCIEILDLANVGSCMRILTEDLGRMDKGRMVLLGRTENSPQKGCSLFQADI